MTTTATDTPRDPWGAAHAPWTPTPGTRAERATAQQFRKPHLWEHLVHAEDRALIAALAGEVLEAEPDIDFAFGGRLLERLRARGAATPSAAERERLHGLEMILSREVPSLSDLLARVRALTTEEV